MIKIRDLTFEYYDRDEEGNLTEMVNAIRGIRFDAKKGDFIAVIGKNGSGKSTFAKILNRLLLPIEGTVVIGGLNAMEEENIIPIRKLVGMVFQNPDDQLVGSIVEEDVAFGAENLGVPGKELRNRVDRALEQVKVNPKSKINELSGGEKQKTAIAGILAMKPRCIVMDEATSMLDCQARLEILALMEGLREQGITVINITHNMDEALLADEIYVMHGGKMVAKGRKNRIFAEEEKLLSVGLEFPAVVKLGGALKERLLLKEDAFSVESLAKQIRERYPHRFLRETSLPKPQRRADKVSPTRAIMLQDVTVCRGEKVVLQHVNCRIKKGEYVAIVGRAGAGKSTLLELLLAFVKPKAGAVYVDGVEVFDSATNLQTLRKKIGFVFQFPERQLFAKNVYEDVVFGPRNMGISEIEAERRAYEAISLMGLPQDVYDLPMDKLSGGQKRRVAMAGVIAMQPEYLVLDEPTAGLDPQGKRELLEIIHALHRDAGITVVMVTHDMEGVLEYADRMIALEDAGVVYDGAPEQGFYELWLRRMEAEKNRMEREDISAEDVQRENQRFLRESLCDLPVITRLLITLRLAGLDVPCQAGSTEEGVAAVERALLGGEKR